MAQSFNYLDPVLITDLINAALKEDIGPGDYSTLASIEENTQGTAELIIKDNGILAGIDVAKKVFSLVDKSLVVQVFFSDGDTIKVGDVVLRVIGNARAILSSERLVLNIMQRMSGIATNTNKLVAIIEGTGAQLLDTRKTTPNFRIFEKWAVNIGGGKNHRFALFDMIMLKDNHIDYAGGIDNAVSKTKSFLKKNNLDIKIEVETRSIDEVQQALLAGGVDIILLDNMSNDELIQAVNLVDNQCATEASGGITINNIRSVAETGVDFISVGALTHSYKSLDMSLKAVLSK
jgi:nicotinate-nucleotide pyrophosphorylase (carboxylating)